MSTKPQSDGSKQAFGKAFKMAVKRDEVKPATYTELALKGPKFILMHPKRRDLFECICMYSCISLSELARRVKLSVRAIKWHLAKLKEGKFIEITKLSNKRVAIYPTELIKRNDVRLVATVNDGINMKLYKVIQDEDWITLSKLSAMLGLTHQALMKHLTALINLGLITECRDGKYKRFKVTPLLRRKSGWNKRRQKLFKTHVMQMLKLDGMQPELRKDTGHELQVIVRTVDGKSILVLRTDPFAIPSEQTFNGKHLRIKMPKSA
jgi:DNA-binding transcriptional ArsR family regulator